MISDPVQALWYLAGGLVAIWGLLAAYVGLLSVRLRRAEREIERLEEDARAPAGE